MKPILDVACGAAIDRCFQDQGKCHECCLVKGNLDEVEKAMIDWLEEEIKATMNDEEIITKAYERYVRGLAEAGYGTALHSGNVYYICHTAEEILGARAKYEEYLLKLQWGEHFMGESPEHVIDCTKGRLGCCPSCERAINEFESMFRCSNCGCPLDWRKAQLQDIEVKDVEDQE